MKKNALYFTFAISVLLVLYSTILALQIPYNLGTYLPGLAGIALGLICILRKQIAYLLSTRLGKKLTPFLYIGITLFCISFSAMVIAININANKIPESGADAVIVLGAGLRGEQVSRTLASRLNVAAEYLENNPDTIVIVSGGMGAGETVTEAYAMKNYLLRKGIDESRILCEEESTSTMENFEFSKIILDEHFAYENYTVVFATNDFHCIRAGIYAERAGFSAQSLAAPSMRSTIPADYCREYLALIWAILPF